MCHKQNWHEQNKSRHQTLLHDLPQCCLVHVLVTSGSIPSCSYTPLSPMRKLITCSDIAGACSANEPRHVRKTFVWMIWPSKLQALSSDCLQIKNRFANCNSKLSDFRFCIQGFFPWAIYPTQLSNSFQNPDENVDTWIRELTCGALHPMLRVKFRLASNLLSYLEL